MPNVLDEEKCVKINTINVALAMFNKEERIEEKKKRKKIKWKIEEKYMLFGVREIKEKINEIEWK